MLVAPRPAQPRLPHQHLLHKAPPWGFTDGQLEGVKWVAMGFMFLDHFGRLLLGHGLDSWVFAASRVTFPLFAITLALNLAREGDRAGRSLRTALRLGLWCAVSIVPSVWARGEPWLINVLGTLALGAALCWAFASQGPAMPRIALVIAGAVAARFVEFDVPGVLLIPAVFLWASERRADAGVAALAALGVTTTLNAQFGGWPAAAGTLACLPVLAAARALPLQVPRLKLAFYLVYPVHLAIIGALKSGA